jgi:hypothetical protein
VEEDSSQALDLDPVGSEASGSGPRVGQGAAPSSRSWSPWRSVTMASMAYLGLSIVVWWKVWTSHPSSVTTCGCGDSSLFLWFIEWPAHAMAHGLNPLYSTAVNYPVGINLLSNTGELAVGVVLAPVTWLFGPVVTLNVALTLAPALSALAMFILLRRWVSWTPAAFIGGLGYGFSPLILIYLTDGHLMLGLGMVPPLVIACLDELLIRQRRRPMVTGVGLGLLVVLQFFVSTEVLFIMVAMGLLGLVLVVAYTRWKQPVQLRLHARFAAVGLLAAAVTSAVLLAYPTWFALFGPAHFSGSVWPGGFFFGGGTTSLTPYLLPQGGNRFFDPLLHSLGGYQGPLLSPQYLGIGLIVVLAGGVLVWRRDRRLWLFGILALVSVALSVGVGHAFLLRPLAHVPLLDNVEPNHIVFATYLTVSIMLGLIVDHVRKAVNRRRLAGTEMTIVPRGQRKEWPRWAGSAAGVVVAVIALVPPGWYLAQSVPFTTQAVVLPDWFRTVAPDLTGRPVVLVFPAWFISYDTAMTWQAVDGMSFTMIGAAAPAGLLQKVGAGHDGAAVIAGVSRPSGLAAVAHGAGPLPSASGIGPADVTAVRQALDRWGVTTVVIPDQPKLPSYDQVPSVTLAAELMAAATGRLPTHRADAWVWTGVGASGPPVTPTAEQFAACRAGLAPRGVDAVERATSCVLGTAAAGA